VRDTVPVAASIAPLALVIGATAARSACRCPPTWPGPPSSSPEPRTWPCSPRSAQGALTALSAAALINVRLLLYSASIEPRFRRQPRWFRWLGPALLIDQTYLHGHRPRRPRRTGPVPPLLVVRGRAADGPAGS
jgi:hypothetical protein